MKVGPAIAHLKGNNLKLILSDKGGFVVIPSGMYDEKAKQAIGKNFVERQHKQVNTVLKRAQMQVKGLCDDMGLEWVARSVQRSKKNHLDVFFSVKMHKPLRPFRARVTECGTWQREVATYLQGYLRGQGVDDPFLVSNSDATITVFMTLTM